MKKKTVRNLLWNRGTLLFILFVIIQQLLSAASNFCIVDLSVATVEGLGTVSFYLAKIALYMGLLVLAEVPSLAAARALEDSEYRAVDGYTKAFAESHANKPILSSEGEFRNEQEVWLTTRAPRTISDTLGILYNGGTIALGVLFNVGAICWIGNPQLLFGYSASTLLMLLSTKYFNNNLINVTIAAGRDRGNLDSILQSGWDNIVIGNKYNLKIWIKHFVKKLGLAKNSSVHLLTKARASEIVTRFIISVPVFINVGWLISINIKNPAALAALLATLPVQMRLLPAICGVSSYISLWNKTKIELKLLENSLTAPSNHLLKQENDYPNRIKWDLIKFTQEDNILSFSSIASILKKIETIQFGRISIRGSNGSGKSTVVALMKQVLKGRSTYIPATSKLAFESTFSENVSMGQKMKMQLTELIRTLSSKESHVLILDEWDANLDNESIIEISSLLDIFSRRQIVIEIRHRNDPTDAISKHEIFDKKLFFQKTHAAEPGAHLVSRQDEKKRLVELAQKRQAHLNNQQRGWNCFDVAVGIKDREELVQYALKHANEILFRKLLAPEILHAAAITAIYMEHQKVVAKKNRKKMVRIKRILELFQISETLNGTAEKEQVDILSAKLILRNIDVKSKQDLESFARNALPPSFRTESLLNLVNDYYSAHEAMKKTVAHCNDLLGYFEGRRLSLEKLDEFFSNANKQQDEATINSSHIIEARKIFLEGRDKLFTPAEEALKRYCENEEIYVRYVREYYGKEGWVAFQRYFKAGRDTSMVDIAALMLQKQIKIYQNQRFIYDTRAYGAEIIHISYVGLNHFVRLDPSLIVRESKHSQLSTTVLTAASAGHSNSIVAGVGNGAKVRYDESSAKRRR